MNVKYHHINTDQVMELYRNGKTRTQIAEFYGVAYTVIESRIARRKEREEREAFLKKDEPKPKPKKLPLEERYTPIRSLPKMNSEVRTYRMELTTIHGQFGRPGVFKENVPAHLWSREGI